MSVSVEIPSPVEHAEAVLCALPLDEFACPVDIRRIGLRVKVQSRHSHFYLPASLVREELTICASVFPSLGELPKPFFLGWVPQLRRLE